MEGGVAIMSKSAVLSGSATASRRDRGEGGGVGWRSLFRNVFWMLARRIAPGALPGPWRLEATSEMRAVEL